MPAHLLRRARTPAGTSHRPRARERRQHKHLPTAIAVSLGAPGPRSPRHSLPHSDATASGTPRSPTPQAVGAFGGLGKLNLGWALLGALPGSVGAGLLWYGVGRRWGDRVLRAAAARRARELFLAHRLGALVIGKFLLKVNAAVAAIAGSSGIRVGAFLAYDTASALLWTYEDTRAWPGALPACGSGLLSGAVKATKQRPPKIARFFRKLTS